MTITLCVFFHGVKCAGFCDHGLPCMFGLERDNNHNKNVEIQRERDFDFVATLPEKETDFVATTRVSNTCTISQTAVACAF